MWRVGEERLCRLRLEHIVYAYTSAYAFDNNARRHQAANERKFDQRRVSGNVTRRRNDFDEAMSNVFIFAWDICTRPIRSLGI